MKLKITEKMWGIDCRAGEYRVKKTGALTAECAPGQEILFPSGRRRFVIDAVTADGVTVSVRYADPKHDRAWTLARGESAFYRPRSMDGGYQYTLKLK